MMIRIRAFLQPIGIFFIETANTVTFFNFKNCNFLSTIPRVQAVVTFVAAIIALHCFKSFPVIQFVFLQQ